MTMGRQYDKQHAATLIATAALLPHRFIGFAGAYANNAARAYDANDCCGVSETAAASGSSVSVITGYSALVEAGEAIAAGLPVTVGANGVAMLGTGAAHVGRSLTAATAAGQLIEVRLSDAVHPLA
jgi:hypothetical protein